MDFRSVLSKETFWLRHDLSVGVPIKGRLVVKNEPEQTYLIVDQEQWQILRRFREGSTVAQLVPKLIATRKCPPLKELYELILKARQEKLLLTEEELEEAPDIVKPFPWPLGMSYQFAQFAGMGFILFGVISLIRNPVDLPRNLLDIVLAYIVILLSLSVGSILAACVVKGFGGKVYRPHLHLKTLLPHLRFDLADAYLKGRECLIGDALMRLSPLLLAAGICSFRYPHFEYVIILGIVLSIDPFTHNPFTQLLSTLYAGPRLSTQSDFLFVQNKLFYTLLHWGKRFQERQYLLAYSGYFVAWVVFVFVLHIRVFNVQVDKVYRHAIESSQQEWVQHTLLVVVMAFGIVSVALVVWLFFKNLLGLEKRKGAVRRETVQAIPAESIKRDDILQLLERSTLFQDAPARIRQTVASALRKAEVKKGDYICYAGEPGDLMYIVYAGKIDIINELPNGKVDVIASLKSGDAFGEIALLDRTPRTRSVVAETDAVLLTLDRYDFMNLVVKELGADKIKEAIQVHAFLKRCELSRNWHPQARQYFIANSNMTLVEPGQLIIRKGEDNLFFHIVYEGEFQVIRNGKKVATLKTGDSFGEISLLQSSLSESDVVAIKESKCLSMHKKNFLHFLGEDFLVGLQFEELSSKRLKKPIFPLE